MLFRKRTPQFKDSKLFFKNKKTAADIKNVGKAKGGSTTAKRFSSASLQETKTAPKKLSIPAPYTVHFILAESEKEAKKCPAKK